MEAPALDEDGQRTAGQMKFNHYLDRIVADLKADDRMAVFSFDSHLKFRRR